MFSPLKAFPASWLTSVTVIRGGGRDSKGYPQPTTEIPLDECLVGPRSTSEPVDFSEVVDNRAMLYRRPGFEFLAADRVRVPKGARMAGDWSVDGRPGEWPYGWEVGLVRA